MSVHDFASACSPAKPRGPGQFALIGVLLAIGRDASKTKHRCIGIW